MTLSAERIQAVTNCKWPVPTGAKHLRSFLRLANFYLCFVHNFAKIASPLNELTCNKVPYTWTTRHQQAFDALRHALISPPVLNYPKQSDQFVLTTDALDVGLGAMLSTKWGTVAEFASRVLSMVERKYATNEKECLAIVWAVCKLCHFLLGTPFILKTDYKPFLWLESAKSTHARSQRLER